MKCSMKEFKDFEYKALDGYLYLKKYNGNSEHIEIDSKGAFQIVICEGCFEDNYALETIVMSDDVVQLRRECFKNCAYLENVIIPKELDIIPDHAFDNCKSLHYIDLKKVKIIGNGAFCGCEYLETVKGHPGDIRNNAFYNCVDLRDIDLSNTLVINNQSFYNCHGLRNLELKNIHKINGLAFSHCIIDSLTIDSRMDSIINQSSFQDSYIDKLIVKSNVEISGPLEASWNDRITVNSYVSEFGLYGANVLYIEGFEELYDAGYNERQINQILKAYEKGIFLNGIPTKVDESIFRIINEEYEKDPWKWQRILNSFSNKTSLEVILDIYKAMENREKATEIVRPILEK